MLCQDSYVYQLQDGYLSPIVFARLESPTSTTKLFELFFNTSSVCFVFLTPTFSEGVMISIECRAYDQWIVHNSQEAIGLVHFEVKVFFRIIHHCHSAVWINI